MEFQGFWRGLVPLSGLGVLDGHAQRLAMASQFWTPNRAFQAKKTAAGKEQKPQQRGHG